MAAETEAARQGRARRISAGLSRAYPDARCTLDFATPLELLVATILSAQCTDERVNRVTPALFQKYRRAADFAKADPRLFEQEIRSTGFYRAKAKSILGCARALVEHHGGEVPRTMEELVELPGVGRKTANVLLGNCFGVPGVVVDTHVLRVSRRLGLTGEKDPEKIERDLNALFPEARWTGLSHQLILHGRRVCRALKPQCESCPLEGDCPRVGVEGTKGGRPPRKR